MLTFKDIRCPPSLNNLYPTHGTKRVRSSEYRAWVAAAGWEIKIQWQAQGGQPIDGPYRLIVTAHINLRRDPDNLWKALLDLLVELGITEGDTAWHNRYHAMVILPPHKEWPEERVDVRISSWDSFVNGISAGGSGEVGGVSDLERDAGGAKAHGVAVAHDEVDDGPPA